MKKTIRFLAIALVITACFSLYGCSKPKKADVLAAYNELYPRAFTVTEYIYGKGLPYDGTYEGATSPNYVPVSADSPYKSVDELKAAVLEVYTEGYYDSTLKYVLFESIAPDEQGMTGSAPPRYKEQNGTLYVDTAYKPLNLVKCDPSQAYIVEIKSKSAIVGAKREGTDKDKSFLMALTENGWRFYYFV